MKLVNEDGYCIICSHHANAICFNCSTYICEEHEVHIPFQKPTIKTMIFCPRCKNE